MPRAYCVYILTNASRTLYIGVTNDIARRLAEHRVVDASTFTGRYNITRLVHVEYCGHAVDAIAREKQLKGWSRAKKIGLIESTNPQWRDLTDEVLTSLILG